MDTFKGHTTENNKHIMIGLDQTHYLITQD